MPDFEPYRKKPVCVMAVQWNGTKASAEEIIVRMRRYGGKAWYEDGSTGSQAGLFVETLEGVMRAQPRDFIIQGVKGEFYPCKPDIFDSTYDKEGIV